MDEDEKLELLDIIEGLEHSLSTLKAEFEGAKDELLHVHRLLLPYLLKEKDNGNHTH